MTRSDFGCETIWCMHRSFAPASIWEDARRAFREMKIHFIIAQTAPQVNQSQLSFVRNFTFHRISPCCHNIWRPLRVYDYDNNKSPSFQCVLYARFNHKRRRAWEVYVGAATRTANTLRLRLRWHDSYLIVNFLSPKSCRIEIKWLQQRQRAKFWEIRFRSSPRGRIRIKVEIELEKFHPKKWLFIISLIHRVPYPNSSCPIIFDGFREPRRRPWPWIWFGFDKGIPNKQCILRDHHVRVFPIWHTVECPLSPSISIRNFSFLVRHAFAFRFCSNIKTTFRMIAFRSHAFSCIRSLRLSAIKWIFHDKIVFFFPSAHITLVFIPNRGDGYRITTPYLQPSPFYHPKAKNGI